MRFGENLKYLMRKRKMSGETLGKAIGKSKSAISHYIHGTVSPSVNDLVIIRNTFQVDLDSLFFKDLTREKVETVEVVVPKKDILADMNDKLSEVVLKLAQLEKQLQGTVS